MNRPRVALFLFLSLVLLRIQVVRDLGLDFRAARAAGLELGIVYDAAAAFLPLALAALVGALSPRLANEAGLLASFAVWIAGLANLLYFRFFNGPLEWWAVKLHWRDLGEVYDSAFRLGLSFWTLASFAAFALVTVLWAARRNADRNRLGAFLAGLLFLGASLALKQSPVWTHSVFVGAQHRGSILSSQVLFRWWAAWRGKDADAAIHVNAGAMRPREQARIEAVKSLADWRGLANGAGGPPSASYRSRQGAGARSPLLARYSPADGVPAKLRGWLGLSGRDPSVILLVVESLRGYEFLHPEIGPAIFPRLYTELKSRGALFAQTYSSSLTAGQTVRGQFSLLCSMLPDPSGPATYLAYPTAKVRCLQELMRARGYETFWMNGARATFHNQGLFESTHGSARVVDEQDFAALGVRERVGGWGLADGPTLQAALGILEKAHSDKPVFATFMTSSSHHPFSIVPGPAGALPERMNPLSEGNPEHRAYLSRLRYVDESIGDFLAKLWAGPMGENTVVVIVADHSLAFPPSQALPPSAHAELAFRVPLLILSKKLSRPLRSELPAHQVDVAPTLAAIVGLEGEVAWMGRELVAPTERSGIEARAGTPFVYADAGGLAYRVGELSCRVGPAGAADCWRVSAGQDPLFGGVSTPAPEERSLSVLAREAIRANGELLRYDLLLTE